MQVISIVSVHFRKDNEPAPLKYEYIHRLVPHGGEYLRALIDLGVIVRTGNAIPGQTSYRYSFAPEYQSRFISVPLKDTKFIRRIQTVFGEIREEARRSVRANNEQVRFLERLRIEPGYVEVLDRHRTEVDRYNAMKAAAVRIENGEIHYSIDGTSGRFHSNITNLSKELRPYLRINGHPLASVDVKNCQPYLTTVILTNPSKVSWMTTSPEFSELLSRLTVNITEEDVQRYILLVANGEIYEYLMAAFSEAGLELTRDETKVQVLRILFARNRRPQNEENALCRDVFRQHFPMVHKIFSKVRGNLRGDKFTSYKRFAILMQRLEAFLMLEVVLKRIRRELPNTIAITVHDSVMTSVLTDDSKNVKAIITEELENFVGIRPRVKIETFSSEKIPQHY